MADFVYVCVHNTTEFPVEPRLSKVLLASFDFHCTEEVLSIVAMLQVQHTTSITYSMWI